MSTRSAAREPKRSRFCAKRSRPKGTSIRSVGVPRHQAAIGRQPKGEGCADEHLRTANERIWAAGDVTGHQQFVYVAGAHGVIAVDNAFGNAGRTVDYRTLPRVTFTTPNIASVGMTDAESQEAGLECECRTIPLSLVPRAPVNRDTRGVVKIVAEATTGIVRGVHIVAPNAGDAILAGLRDRMPDDGPLDSKDLVPVSHHVGRHPAGGAGVHDGRRQSVLLRCLTARNWEQTVAAINARGIQREEHNHAVTGLSHDRPDFGAVLLLNYRRGRGASVIAVSFRGSLSLGSTAPTAEGHRGTSFVRTGRDTPTRSRESPEAR